MQTVQGIPHNFGVQNLKTQATIFSNEQLVELIPPAVHEQLFIYQIVMCLGGTRNEEPVPGAWCQSNVSARLSAEDPAGFDLAIIATSNQDSVTATFDVGMELPAGAGIFVDDGPNNVNEYFRTITVYYARKPV